MCFAKKNKVAKISGKNIFPKNIRKNKSTILTKNKLQRIAKNKLQISKFVKSGSGSGSSGSSGMWHSCYFVEICQERQI